MRLILATCLLLAQCPAVLGQVGAMAAGSETALPVIGPAFEVATIRPSNPEVRASFLWKVTPAGRFMVAHQTLFNLVVLAYGGKPGSVNVVDERKREDSEAFDVDAKVDDAYVAGWDKLSEMERFERVKPMLRGLLTERFRLKVRVEMRPTPVYGLVQAKGGAKLKGVGQAAAEDPEEQEKRKRHDPAAKAPPGGMFLVDGAWKGNAVPIANLVGFLSGVSGAEYLVVDSTGLKGFYDFTLRISRVKDVPTAAEQIEEQLGLRLELRKAPVKTYVIESAERPSVDGA